MKKVVFLVMFLVLVTSVYGLEFHEFDSSYQLADTLVVSGVSEEGFLSLKLKCGSVYYAVGEEFYVENGFIEEIIIEEDMEGSCKIVATLDGDTIESDSFIIGDVEVVEDESTSSEEEEVVEVVEVEQTILVSAILNEINYEPGDKLVIEGMVDKFGVTIVANIDGKEFVTVGEDFKVVYKLPKNIKSGKHEVLIEAKNDYGDYGKINLNFNVEAVPIDLAPTLGDSYNPGDEISLLVNLYDQAGDLISGNYELVIYEGWSKTLENRYPLNEEVKLKLPDFAEPGLRKVKIKAFDLSNSIEFLVNEVEMLDIELNGDVLVIRNIGNVYFSDELEINEVSKKLYLGVGEFEELDLSNLFDKGVYNINIPLIGDYFEGVSVDDGGVLSGVGSSLGSITGGAVFGVKKAFNNFGYYVLGFLILFVLVLIISNRRVIKKIRDKKRASDFKDGQKKLRELKGNIKPYQKYKFGKSSNDDFKGRVVKMFDRTERKQMRRAALHGSTNEPKKKDDSSGGLFSMFK